jgi:hypothetical protein
MITKQRHTMSLLSIRLISLLTALFCFFVPTLSQELSKILYSGSPNHREIAVRAFRLAVQAGFRESGLDTATIRDRLEAGAYNEDYEPVPGVVGSHFPNPWDQGPEFTCASLPIQRIPYGPLGDPSRRSGWYRGLPHGFDPTNNFKWPGAVATTIEWANDSINSFTWGNAIALYRLDRRLEAYQCLGHVLHLLMDLSVPAHVKVVNHGASLLSLHSGTWYDPDYAQTTLEDYETALSGGLNIPTQIEIPDLLGAFRSALYSAQVTSIPDSSSVEGLFRGLAISTYYDSLVNRYYAPPAVNGQFGFYKDANGIRVDPSTYAQCPGTIDGRWTVMSLMGTAHPSPVIPTADMTGMCNRLVPKAVEYCAGLILLFYHQATTGVENTAATNPCSYSLGQNYPNPFNPSTAIEYSVPQRTSVEIKVFDVLGREVATLLNEEKSAGVFTVRWDASGMASGVYFYQLQAGSFVDVKKLILLK